jgi:hypothetical protein
MVPPLAAACLCLFTLAHSSSTGHATAAAAETADGSATAADRAEQGKQPAASLSSAPDKYKTLTGQPGRCSDSSVDHACDSVQQPFVTQEATRRRLLQRLWDFITGQHLVHGGPWYTSKGRLLRVAAAASITAQQVSVAFPLERTAAPV